MQAGGPVSRNGVREATNAIPISCASSSSPPVIDVHIDGKSTQHRIKEPKRDKRNMKGIVVDARGPHGFYGRQAERAQAYSRMDCPGQKNGTLQREEVPGRTAIKCLPRWLFAYCAPSLSRWGVPDHYCEQAGRPIGATQGKNVAFRSCLALLSYS